MSRRAVYKTFREENGEIKLNLTVSQVEDTFEVEEEVHNVHIAELTSDGLNEVLSELEIPEEVKLEIKKAVLKKQVGLLEDKKSKFDELLPRIKDDADFVADNIEIEYRQFEERIKKELNELEAKFDKFLDRF
ncbi:hypothetical protein R2F61_05075 [Mollicutes bacterium LVI A0078]|nr:hypothetical protein RZE84_05095 [Mollicutes bacterium LVI A0075]WOO90100.1 hypothetical protein R2F61_05075 [Mollicutes bacterium LVI A0078]